MGAFSQDADAEPLRLAEDPAEHFTTTAILHKARCGRLKEIGAEHYRQPGHKPPGLSPMLRMVVEKFIDEHDAAEAAANDSASQEVAA